MSFESARNRFSLVVKASTTFLLLALFTFSLSAQDAAAAPTAAGVYNEGLAALKTKDYVKGFPLMEEALKLATESNNEQVIGLAKKNGAMAAYNLGLSKLKAKSFDEANGLFNKAKEMSPSSSSSYIGLARVMKEQGKYDEAMDAFFVGVNKAKAEKKMKKAADAEKRAKGIVTSVYKAKKYEDVVTLGEKFLANAKNADVSYYVGKSMVANGDDAGAIAHFDNALGMIKDKDKVNYAKAQSLEKLGKNTEAVAAYKLVTGEKYKAQVDHKVSTLK